MALWQRRAGWAGRAGLAAALLATAIWGFVLLNRTSDWFPFLRWITLVAGILGAAALLALPLLRRTPRLAIGLVAALGLGGALVAPLFSTVATASVPHSGAIPTVTPTPAGAGFGGGFGAFGSKHGGFPGFAGLGTGAGRGTGFGRRFNGGFPGGTVPGGFPGGRSVRGGSFPGGGVPGGGGFPRGGFPGGGFPGGGSAGGVFRLGGAGGGFLNATTPGAALTKMLESDASHYTWVAATVNSNSAAGYQLASDDPVMAIGGFNGTDPTPSLAQFEKYVAEGKIHYFIAGGGAGGFGSGGSGDDASRITSWVESHFTAKTIDGATVYDLTDPSTTG